MIDVEHINIVEADGNVRIVIANTPRTPGPMEHGKPYGEGPGQRMGMIFYSDETRAGGLIFSGKANRARPKAIGSLTFDQFNRDQALALEYVEFGVRRRCGSLWRLSPFGDQCRMAATGKLDSKND